MSYLDNTGLAYFWEKIKSNFFPGTKLIPGNSDLNDYTTPGVYYCPGNVEARTLVNVPVHLAFSLMVLKTTGDGSCRQIFMPYPVGTTNENTNRIWTRAFYDYDGGWGEWCQIVTSMDRPVEYTTVGYESSAYSADKPWHKVAEFPYTIARQDRRVIFTVTDSYMDGTAAPYGRVDAKNGILRVHIRRNDDFNAEGKYFTKLTWILNTGYDTEDFVLIYVPDTNALELWTRVPNRWNYRTFNVIENGNIYGGNRCHGSRNPLITYGRVSNTGAQASYPSGDGYIAFKSVMADIQQAAKGIKDCGIKYDLIPARLGTANGFSAGDSILKYFNSGSSISVENGAPTYTDGINRRDGHVLYMPWDWAGGYDSMLAVPNDATSLADSSMATVSWRTGIGPTGVTTDENGNAIQTGYTDWFHLIDDRFTIDGVHPKKQHVIHYGYCETEAATAAKTVDIPHFELVTGAFVIIKFKYTNTAASGSTTLNVSGTGAKNIKYRNGNVPASDMLASAKPCMFVYDGTYWQVIGDWEFHTRQFDRLKLGGGIYPKEAITTTTIIVNDGTGYIKLNSRPFDITYPILATGGSLTANTQNSNVYSVYPFAIKNTQNFTMTQNAPVFVKGTLNGVIFTPVGSTPLVQTLPNTEDGYQYLYLGYAYTTTTMQLVESHPIVEYVGGAIRPYQTAIATNSDIDSIFN